jgi:serralysin
MVDIPGNNTSTATFEGSPGVIATFSGELEAFGDTDWIRVTLFAGGTYQFFGSAESAGVNGGNSRMLLRDASGAIIDDNDNHGIGVTQNSYLTYSPAATGTYFIEIKGADNLPGSYGVVSILDQPVTRLTATDNVYTGTGGFLIVGDKGDDEITIGGTSFDALGEQGDDYIDGNANVNHVSGGLGNDSIFGFAGNDRLFGDAGHDYIDGGIDDDLVYGGAGADHLRGDAGNDKIFTGEGADLAYGGAGNDEFYVDNAADRVFENAGEGSDGIATRVSYALLAGQQVEILAAEVRASTAPLNLAGNEFANLLAGNNGTNVLDGGAGADVLVGFLGNDIYLLGNGSDTVNDSGGAADTIVSSIGRSLASYTGIERLTLVGMADVGIGSNLANVISGNSASNTLDGGAGNDTLIGNAGTDYLIGSTGKDVSTGGAGNDIFRFLALTHSPVGAGADVIMDFDDSGDDRIDLINVFGGVMTYRHNAAFTAAGQVRISDTAGPSVLVEVNTGGSLAADIHVWLANTTLASMSAGDFYL